MAQKAFVLSGLPAVLSFGAAAAIAPCGRDGRFAVAYLPTGRTVTVDMGKFSGRVTAQWFGPTNGEHLPIAGSPFENSDKETSPLRTELAPMMAIGCWFSTLAPERLQFKHGSLKGVGRCASSF